MERVCFLVIFFLFVAGFMVSGQSFLFLQAFLFLLLLQEGCSLSGLWGTWKGRVQAEGSGFQIHQQTYRSLIVPEI